MLQPRMRLHRACPDQSLKTLRRVTSAVSYSPYVCALRCAVGEKADQPRPTAMTRLSHTCERGSIAVCESFLPSPAVGDWLTAAVGCPLDRLRISLYGRVLPFGVDRTVPPASMHVRLACSHSAGMVIPDLLGLQRRDIPSEEPPVFGLTSLIPYVPSFVGDGTGEESCIPPSFDGESITLIWGRTSAIKPHASSTVGPRSR